MGLFAPSFIFSLALCSLVSRSEYLASMPHRLLEGLRFWLAPSDGAVSLLAVDGPKSSAKQRKRARTRNGLRQHPTDNITLQFTEIGPSSLQKHPFFDNFSVLLLMWCVAVATFALDEVWACLRSETASEISALLLLLSALLAWLSLVRCVLLLGVRVETVSVVVFSLLMSVVSALVLFFLTPEHLDIDFAASHASALQHYRALLTRLAAQQQVSVEDLPSLPSIVLLKCGLVVSTFMLSMATTLSSLRTTRCSTAIESGLTKSGTQYSFFEPILDKINFIAPLFLCLLWYRPVSRDLFVVENTRLTNELFENCRFVLLIACCIARFLQFRSQAQAFLVSGLVTASTAVPTINSLTALQNNLRGIYSYLLVIAIQLISPSIILLSLSLTFYRTGTSCLHICSFVVGSSSSASKESSAGLSLLSNSLSHSVISFLLLVELLSIFASSCVGVAFVRSTSSLPTTIKTRSH